MKKFGDLESGDKVYILIFNKAEGIICHRSATFSVKAKENSSINSELLCFREKTETSVVVESDKYWKSITLTETSITKLIYFSDREAIDWFLKKEKDKLYNFISRIEEEYNAIWSEESTKSEELNIPMRGDLLYDVTFSEVILYAGKNVGYTIDGLAISNVLQRRTESVTPKQAEYFMRNMEILIVSSSLNKSARLVEILNRCGYRVNRNTGEIRKMTIEKKLD